jgi:hypothetical protein
MLAEKMYERILSYRQQADFYAKFLEKEGSFWKIRNKHEVFEKGAHFG